MNQIIAHQAIFGDVELGHELISTSGFQDKALLSELTYKYTDRHPNFEWCGTTQFTRGDVIGNYYVLTRIALDPTSTRAGLVVAQSLIFELSAILQWQNFIQLIRGLSAVPERQKTITPIIFSEESYDQVVMPDGYSKITSLLIHKGSVDNKPLIWVGEEGFFESLHFLWRNVWPEARKRITFNASSGPSDVAGNPLLLLVPENCTTKWYGQDIIRSTDKVEPTTLGERFLLGEADGAPLWELQQQLNIDETMSLSDITLLQHAYQTVENLDKSPSLTKAAQLMRLIAGLTPNASQGAAFKQSRMQQLCELIAVTQIAHLPVLRNVKTYSFGDSAACLETTIAARLDEYFAPRQLHTINEFSTVLFSVAVENEAFWNQAVTQFLGHMLGKTLDEATARFLWELWLQDLNTIPKAFPYLLTSEASEKVLQQTCPQSLTSDQGETIRLLSVERRWFRLHAVIVSRYSSFEEGLTKQLLVERDSHSFTGLDELISQYRQRLSGRELVTKLLEFPDTRIPQIVGSLCQTSPEILLELNPQDQRLQEVWLHALNGNRRLLEGLFVPIEFVYALLDGVCDGNETTAKFAPFLSESRYRSVLNYPRRKELWSALPRNLKGNFLEATAAAWLDELIQGSLSDEDVVAEHPLQEAIARSSHLPELLKSPWEESSSFAIRIFTILQEHIGQNQFVRWFLIPQLQNNVPVKEAKAVGAFVAHRRWKDAAREIYKGVKEYNRATPWIAALHEVEELVPNRWQKDIEKGLEGFFGRWQPPRIQHTTSVRPRKLRVLLILADPKNQPHLLLSQEAKRLEDATRNSRRFYPPSILFDPHLDDLQTRLQDYKPTIVHFSGHGSKSGELVFEDQYGNATMAPPEALATLFALLKHNIQCVVLNACYSEAQANAIAHEIDYVVGMSNKIRDDAAIQFTKAFYQSLASEGNFEKAFNLGRNSMDLHRIPGADIPVLLGRKFLH